MPDRIYCSLSEVIDDIGVPGFKDESGAIAKIRSASDWIDKRLGMFIPFTETKRFDGNGRLHLFIPPLLQSDPTIVDDGDTLAATDYLLYPRNRHWENGPYTWITVDPDASALNAWTAEADIITIAARWGRYEETVDTEADTANDPLASGGLTLNVDNGGKVSPGCVLKIGTEQILITAYGTATDLAKNTAEAIDIEESAIDVEASHGLNAGEIIRVDNEQMRVERMEGDTAIVTRGWNGTERATHTDASDIYVYRAFTISRGVNGTTAAEHTLNTDIYRYIPPWDVNYLARQMAVLMIKKAQTGFAGKVANLEAGEIFYHAEFPKSVYKEIKRNYRC